MNGRKNEPPQRCNARAVDEKETYAGDEIIDPIARQEAMIRRPSTHRTGAMA